jgi:hypothetical protein
MAYRVFASPDGTVWQVWEIPALRDEPVTLDPRDESLRQGWLCFESATEKRRLAPVPERWIDRSEQQLWLYCRVADPVRPYPLPAAERGAEPPGEVPEPPPAISQP